MFAIFETGSKQYKVEEGDILEVEFLNKKQISEDNSLDFDSVLLVKDTDVHIGQPFVKNAQIRAKVLEEFKAPKIIVFKKKPKKQYKKTRGHRQKLHRIQIEKIEIKAKAETKAKPKAGQEKEGKVKTAAKAKVETGKEIKTKAKKETGISKETKRKTTAKTKAKAGTAKETKVKATAKAKAKPKPRVEKKVDKKEKE